MKASLRNFGLFCKMLSSAAREERDRQKVDKIASIFSPVSYNIDIA